MKATIEQQNIINAVQAGKDVLVQALAGTGKSTTLRLIAESNPSKNFLVLCFNSANAEESNNHHSKPNNVVYSTVHSLAYQATMKNPSFKKKLNSYLDYTNLDNDFIVEVIGSLPIDGKKYNEIVFKVKRALLDVVVYYCRTDKVNIVEYSASLLTSWFTKPEEGKENDYYRNLELSSNQITTLAKYVKEYWLRLIDHSKPDKITHDVYLKLFELQKSTIHNVYDKKNKCDFSVDVIALDECLTNAHFVKTDKGSIRIGNLHKRIQVGEVIHAKSFNHTTNTFEYKRITASLESHNREVLLIKSEGLNKVHCTANHKILTQRGYVPAGELVTGKDIIYLEDASKQKTKYLLNPIQLQVVLGSYLGDGCLVKQSAFNTFRLSLTQGEKQVNYLAWKARCLKIDKLTLIKSGYTDKFTIYKSGTTKVFLLEDNIDNMLFKLDKLGLAIWYMDDGYINKNNAITISSNSFTLDQHKILLKVLSDNFDLHPTIGQEKSYYNLKFGVLESAKLLLLVQDFIHPDLAYKSRFDVKEVVELDNEYLHYGANYIKSIAFIGRDTVYDITVEDNHNFLTSTSYYSNGIIVHNCQDTNPVTYSVFSNQKHLQQVAVGDENQSLYSWRGASGNMDKLQGFTSLPLCTSFRFNQDIADIANNILSLNTDLRLNGAGTKTIIDTKAHLCRTNATVLSTSIMYMEQGLKVYANIDLNDLFSKLWHIQSCHFNEKPKYPNKELSNIIDKQSLNEAMNYNDQLALIVKLGIYLNQKYGNLTKAKVAISGKILADANGSDITVSTVHRSKGLEFSHVIVDEDLIPDSESNPRDVDEWLSSFDNCCLCYVAITRAEVEVILPSYINEYLEDNFN